MVIILKKQKKYRLLPAVINRVCDWFVIKAHYI